MAVVDITIKELRYYESHPGYESNELRMDRLNKLASYIENESARGGRKPDSRWKLSEWTRRIPPVPRQGWQENGIWNCGSDCGIFALKFADYESRGLPFRSIEQNGMQYYRRRLIADLMCQTA